MKKCILSLAATLLLLTGGCSFFNRSTEMVAINVKQHQGTVILNGTQYSAETPFFAEVSRGQDLQISAYSPKHPTRIYVVGRKLSKSGTVDAWSGILLFPLFGLLSDGAWALETTNIVINLDQYDTNIKDAPAPKEQ